MSGPSCNALGTNYSVRALNSESFDVFKELWIQDAGLSASDAADWDALVPFGTSGAIGLDDICHVNTIFTDEDRIFNGASYDAADSFFGFGDDDGEQQTILKGLKAAHAEKWDGNTVGLLGAFRRFAHASHASFKGDTVGTYIKAVKDSLTSMHEAKLDPSADGIDTLLSGLAPSTLQEPVIKGALEMLGIEAGETAFANVLLAAYHLNKGEEDAAKAAISNINKNLINSTSQDALEAAFKQVAPNFSQPQFLLLVHIVRKLFANKCATEGYEFNAKLNKCEPSILFCLQKGMRSNRKDENSLMECVPCPAGTVVNAKNECVEPPSAPAGEKPTGEKKPKEKKQPKNENKGGNKCGAEPTISNAEYNVPEKKSAYREALTKWKTCTGK